MPKKLLARLDEMEISLKDDEDFIKLMDEFTATLYTTGSVSEELQLKIHDHLEKRFPRIKKGKRRAKPNGLKQTNIEVLD